MRMVAWLGGWMVVGLVACGGKAEDSASDSEPFRFEDLSDEDKFAYMSSDVLPQMQSVFQSYDSVAYEDFGCASCHVTGSADGSFAMPDAGLPQLREEDFPYESDVGHFMADEVLPTMTELLGPKDGGRACTTCHTLEG